MICKVRRVRILLSNDFCTVLKFAYLKTEFGHLDKWYRLYLSKVQLEF